MTGSKQVVVRRDGVAGSVKTGCLFGSQVDVQVVKPTVAHATQINAKSSFVVNFDIEAGKMESQAFARFFGLQAAGAGRPIVVEDGEESIADQSDALG